jgi:tRNA-splicing ligase RtcB
MATQNRAVMKQKRYDFTIYGEETIDSETLQQMETAMKLPVAVGGALMADAHVGYGLPIGGVLAAYNAVIPYGVGMDIGCRMCLSVYPSPPSKVEKEREKIRKILLSETRFGHGVFHDLGNHELLDRSEFRDIKFLKSLQGKFAEQLGTSGHGNHFVDVGFVVIKDHSEKINLDPGEYFAVLSHSGSRNFGAEVCKHYTGIARRKLNLRGRSAQLAWLDLDTGEGQEYWAAMVLAGDYSHANHRIIHRRLADAFGEEPLQIIENHHNFAWKEELNTGETIIIHRKGATPAGKDDKAIIPGTMASPAFIVTGKGNEESLNSASHGAGRVMSRNQAKKSFSEKEMKDYLSKSEIDLIGGGTEEAPMAYKDIFDVMGFQRDLVDIAGYFYPKIVRME